MLVVSRNENDRIVFPQLGISVEVIQLNRSKVKLGIDAPKSIRVLRHELLDGETDSAIDPSVLDIAEKMSKHELANQLNAAMLKLQLAAKMLEMGESQQGLERLTAGIADLNVIESGKKTLSTESPTPLKSAKDSVHKPRVLLVDDDDNERTLMSSYLSYRGLEVRQACDGMEALYELSSDQKPDVVLLDMNMPRMDGRTTVHRIRTSSQHRKVPVFAVTGESIEDCGIEIGHDGVNGWFQKPVEAEQIVSAIQSCFDPTYGGSPIARGI